VVLVAKSIFTLGLRELRLRMSIICDFAAGIQIGQEPLSNHIYTVTDSPCGHVEKRPAEAV
jgi:hypothetical protein